ncbi:hypothetical protein L210DRAFT_3525216 [Boletus edulis BED1]|uniref:Amidohydrolase-related domain-containing protein n=1 Tax=Boletus edulis BED1 TaxID=1328754 RepID=A0AAD4C3W6_BOLED|nr:hypothetical protein L210DRAFT_3525216 [Boletus edulis BED1]
MGDYAWEQAGDTHFSSRRKSRWFRLYTLIILASLLYLSSKLWCRTPPSTEELARRADILNLCRYIKTPSGPPLNFHARSKSDRFSPEAKPTLIKNATIWTSGKNGTEVIYGDLLLLKGLIRGVGAIAPSLVSGLDIEVVDANGAWVTPGLVDLHSHLGVGSAPELDGADDTNSVKAPILPWLRSIDGLNTHDDGYELARSGGVTTAQILPGSANNIGGQAFIIKLRETTERTPSSMLVEPPYTLNGSHFDHDLPSRWRHMKHACGENPSRVYSMSRMDTGWNFRRAYDTARKIRDQQDDFCATAEAGAWRELKDSTFPESLQWEALVDVLRGRVKLSVHCYEAVDLDVIVRLSNEFKFPVASFHHAGQTYLVPDLLRKTWGGMPSIALFAANFRKKREAYRGSEFAPRILASDGFPVVMKSDHSVINSRYLLHEAAQAHYFGLPTNIALLSITATPADAMGLGHRIGHIKEGYDADVIVWDSHPLSLAATPQQVFIDGIPQLKAPEVSIKPFAFQSPPNTPDFNKEAADASAYEGLPPLEPRSVQHSIFTNVSSLYMRSTDDISVQDHPQSVIVHDGKIVCSGECSRHSSDDKHAEIINLEGGSIVPGLTIYGPPLGLTEIRLEPSTSDGTVLNPLAGNLPAILEDSLIRAIDGLQFGGRNTLLAYRAGVTAGVTAPSGSFVRGSSTAFSLGALNLFRNGSIQSDVAVHVAITKNSAQSVSTQIAALRAMLLGKGSDAMLFRVRAGTATLVVDVNSADIMASLLRLKREYETRLGKTLRMTFAGAIESHLIASDIAHAGVSVIVTQPKPFPTTWDQRRFLGGPPLTADSLVSALLAAGVQVGVGLLDEFEARNLRWEVAQLALASNGTIDQTTALALATVNVEKALGIEVDMPQDLVAYKGGDAFGFEGKPVAVISAQFGRTDLFE